MFLSKSGCTPSIYAGSVTGRRENFELLFFKVNFFLFLLNHTQCNFYLVLIDDMMNANNFLSVQITNKAKYLDMLCT